MMAMGLERLKAPAEGAGRRRFQQISCAVAFVTVLLASAAHGQQWWFATDDHPRQVGPTAWSFAINVPVHPVGTLWFLGSQYDFCDLDTLNRCGRTYSIAVDYAYNGPGVDWSYTDPDGYGFLAIAPTLFDLVDRYIHGWSITALQGGKFIGIVYADAPLQRVWFAMVADQIVHGKALGRMR
jgi:hypothetical protein